MKFYIPLFVIIAALLVGGYFYVDIGTTYREAVVGLDQEIAQPKPPEQKVVAPPPLRGPMEAKQATLTAFGTVAETNRHRAKSGLPALAIDSRLTQAAKAKVDDMFARQYFAHESPTGEGPGDLARVAGYEYITVGENLALGNYKSDVALVQAWMDSPGHRANILDAEYTEIGVAVARGTYEGHTTWLAVQEFGRPLSACPAPSTALAAEIEENRALLAQWEAELAEQKEELEDTRPKRGPAYNRKVDEYNELVEEYNALLEETKVLIADYNEQVETFNECI